MQRLKLEMAVKPWKLLLCNIKWRVTVTYLKGESSQLQLYTFLPEKEWEGEHTGLQNNMWDCMWSQGHTMPTPGYNMATHSCEIRKYKTPISLFPSHQAGLREMKLCSVPVASIH